MFNHEILEQLVLFSKMLENKGFLNALEGNVSILDRETNYLYITPSAKSKLLLEPDMIAILDGEGNQIGGKMKRSSEFRIHRAALDARPDSNAVIHSHSPYLTAFALCQKDIELKCAAGFLLGYGKIPCLPYGEPGTPEIYNGMEKHIKNHNLILLGNHGSICIEKDLESCARLLEGAESILQSYMLAKMVGEPVDIPDDKIKSLLENHPFTRKKITNNEKE